MPHRVARNMEFFDCSGGFLNFGSIWAFWVSSLLLFRIPGKDTYILGSLFFISDFKPRAWLELASVLGLFGGSLLIPF
jgi:hypothetical protein